MELVQFQGEKEICRWFWRLDDKTFVVHDVIVWSMEGFQRCIACGQ
jgi:hypothetical protein